MEARLYPVGTIRDMTALNRLRMAFQQELGPPVVIVRDDKAGATLSVMAQTLGLPVQYDGELREGHFRLMTEEESDENGC